MANYVVRRRKLGRTSCKEIQNRSAQGIQCVRNDEMPREMDGWIFRWGCTSTLPKTPGSTVVNEAKAIHWASNKRLSRIAMQTAGIAVPESWDNLGRFVAIDWPAADKFVVRPEHHHQGRNLVVGNAVEAARALQKFGAGYISRLINKTAEYRVFVVQGRVSCVAKKTPGNPDQVAWNVAQGGKFDNVRWDDWPLRAIGESIKAAKLSGLDFCGVDVMTTNDGTPYILEVNSAPSLTSEYRQQCMAKAFDFMIEKNSKDYLGDIARITGWRDVIHPAIWTKGRKNNDQQANRA